MKMMKKLIALMMLVAFTLFASVGYAEASDHLVKTEKVTVAVYEVQDMDFAISSPLAILPVYKNESAADVTLGNGHSLYSANAPPLSELRSKLSKAKSNRIRDAGHA